MNPFVVVRTLLKAHPEAACTENAVGLLPIHVALETHAEIEAIELLAEANRTAVDDMKWTSLHLLCGASGVSTSSLLDKIASTPTEASAVDATWVKPPRRPGEAWPGDFASELAERTPPPLLLT